MLAGNEAKKIAKLKELGTDCELPGYSAANSEKSVKAGLKASPRASPKASPKAAPKTKKATTKSEPSTLQQTWPHGRTPTACQRDSLSDVPESGLGEPREPPWCHTWRIWAAWI